MGRVRGTIKEAPEDFKVEEITSAGVALEIGRKYKPGEIGFSEARDGGFSMIVLQKRNWNTTQALKAIANSVGRGPRSVGFAGTKDRVAESVQLATIFGAEPASLIGINIKDIAINGAWKCDRKISMGELAGNRFAIRVRGGGADELKELEPSLGGSFPNYFGKQRFGTRGNNHMIGLDMLKGDFESAVMRFLSEPGGETNADARAARERLGKSYDFTDALSYFPKHLKYERSLINYLAAHDSDWLGAIRSLPRPLSLMFVHSVENAIFNAEVADRMASGYVKPRQDDRVCMPDAARFFDLKNVYSGQERPDGIVMLNILGHMTERITEFEKESMDGLGIEPADFKVRGISELSCKGSMRVMMSPYREFSAVDEDGAAVVRFSLPAGSYATVMLSQIVDYEGGELIYTFTEKHL